MSSDEAERAQLMFAMQSEMTHDQVKQAVVERYAQAVTNCKGKRLGDLVVPEDS